MIERNFVLPSAPLPEVGADAFLAKFGDRLKRIPASFDGILVLVPTRAAAKNLRNEILAHAVGRGVSAFGGLKISTLEDALGEYSGADEISDTESKAVWLKVLDSVDVGSLSSLFPAESPRRRDFLNVARELSRLQKVLGDNLMSISKAAEILSNTPDAARWSDLSLLESEFEKRASALGKIAHVDVLKRAVEKYPAKRFDALAIIGNPDASPTLKAFAQRFDSEGIEVSITVFADDKSLFDGFGAPLADAYSKVDVGLGDSQIMVFADIAAEARAVSKLAGRFGADANRALAVACEQTESVKLFADEMKAVGVNAVSLEVGSLSKSATADFLRNLKAYGADFSCSAFSNLAMNPVAADDFSALCGKSADQILADCDFLFSATCAASVAQALDAMKRRIRAGSKESDAGNFYEKKYLESLFERAGELCAAMSSDSDSALQTLERIFRNSAYLNEQGEREYRAREIALEAFSDISEAEKQTGARFSPDERFDIALEHLDSASDSPDFGEDRLPLQDWMEIFWSENPQLVLCDMNEGVVPLANSDGMFLNDAVRRKLGLRSQQSRRARDAYMLETLLKSRASEGSSAVVCVPKKSASGDPLSPSRILFQCANLPRRVVALFADAPAADAAAHAEPEWGLSVARKPFTRKLSASAFNAYLDSPWRFYTDYVLRMESFDASKRELGADEFGNAFHMTMKRFADSELRDSSDDAEIAAYLERQFDDIAETLYGKNPRVQLRLQFASLRQRLRACAKIQVEHRREGWCISASEAPFETAFGGVQVRGFFDRVDVRDGETLVIDYKTFDKNHAGIAKEKHVKISKVDGKEELEWLNLQLPIYFAAAKTKYPDSKILCAYFVAPKDSGGAGFDYWDDIADFVSDAESKASEIAEKISQMMYDPIDAPRYDSTPDIFGIGFDTLKKIVKFDK